MNMTMKSRIQPVLLSIGVSLLAFSMTSCDRRENVATDDGSDETVTLYAEKSVNDVVDALVLRSDSADFADCAEITDSGADVFPRTITIDFGDGCTDLQGRTRAGIIEIVLSDDWENLGATRTATFDGYSVSPVWTDFSIALQGVRSLERLPSNVYGQPEFSRAADMTITRGNLTLEHSFSGVRTWISGYEDPENEENIFGLTGAGTAVRNGNSTVTRDIIDTLKYSQSCDEVTEGVLAVTRPLHSATLDFGNGDCDGEATGTLENGNVFTIDLHQFPG
jgi:hypothetical protein